MDYSNNIKLFLSHKQIAVYGVSRGMKGFAHSVFRQLEKRGIDAVAVNPKFEKDGDKRKLRSLQEKRESIKAAIIITNPANTVAAAQDAIDAGVQIIWFQQTSESAEALALCRTHRVDFIEKQCLLMFLQPVTGIHRFHRFIYKITGKLPALYRP